MSRRKSRSALFALLAVVLTAWWFWPSSECKNVMPAGGDFDTLAIRIWIDHIPANERDKINVFLLLDDPTIGVFSKSSAYEGDWSSFEWSLDKGLVLTMLQAGTKHRVHPKVASGAVCAPFDHCLKLKGAPLGAKKYGSMEDWVLDGQQNLDVRDIVTELLANEP